MNGLSGVGFLSGNLWLACIPAVCMVIFAAIAGLTQWCFASALYAWLFRRAYTKSRSHPLSG